MARKRDTFGEYRMIAGLILLCCAYVLSQFFRAFLAVLSTVLQQDVGAGPDDLAVASGLWFLTFAAMQIPIGWALDKFGPRRTASSLLLIGGGGGEACGDEPVPDRFGHVFADAQPVRQVFVGEQFRLLDRSPQSFEQPALADGKRLVTSKTHGGSLLSGGFL